MMIKQIGIGLYLIINCGFTQAQEKWISSAQIDFVFPNNATYSYDNSENHFFKEDFFYNGFLLRSYAIQADYNYLLFKKFSIGVLGGFQTQTKPSYAFLKFGGVLKYYFVNKNEIYVYMHAANNFTINNDKFRNGANARFGFAFPFLKKKDFAVVLHLFKEQNHLKLDGSKPLIGGIDERPRTFIVNSLGISFGVQF